MNHSLLAGFSLSSEVSVFLSLIVLTPHGFSAYKWGKNTHFIRLPSFLWRLRNILQRCYGWATHPTSQIWGTPKCRWLNFGFINVSCFPLYMQRVLLWINLRKWLIELVQWLQSHTDKHRKCVELDDNQAPLGKLMRKTLQLRVSVENGN